jgi:hypothetical protein
MAAQSLLLASKISDNIDGSYTQLWLLGMKGQSIRYHYFTYDYCAIYLAFTLLGSIPILHCWGLLLAMQLSWL